MDKEELFGLLASKQQVYDLSVASYEHGSAAAGLFVDGDKTQGKGWNCGERCTDEDD